MIRIIYKHEFRMRMEKNFTLSYFIVATKAGCLRPNMYNCGENQLLDDDLRCASLCKAAQVDVRDEVMDRIRDYARQMLNR